MVFSVAFGAVILSNFVTVAGLPETIANGINALNIPGLVIIMTICLVYILLGCVFDGLALLFLTVPVFAPMVVTLGYDLIWFGIVVIIVSEIALITPPIGMNVFVLKSMNPELSLRTIFGGIAPFLIADFVRLTIVLLVPGVVLYLPQLMQ
jgi:TRAP-type C4-dicarboxylate transport system permease large subunit